MTAARSADDEPVPGPSDEPATAGQTGVRDGPPPSGWTVQMNALGEFIRAQRQLANLSLREMASMTSVSNAYLSQVERGQHEPSLTMLMAIADGLGVPPATLLAHAGVLGDATPEVVDTATAILRDPALTEPQRVALLSVYRSFVPG
jgi:transcriptional regulator with XRE-family HTH domain